jgi:hypothetical protein
MILIWWLYPKKLNFRESRDLNKYLRLYVAMCAHTNNHWAFVENGAYKEAYYDWFLSIVETSNCGR